MAQNDLELKKMLKAQKTGSIHVNVLFFLTHLFTETIEDRLLG